MAITPVYLEGFDDGVVFSLVGGWQRNVYGSGANATRSIITGRTGSALRCKGNTGNDHQVSFVDGAEYVQFASLLGGSTRYTFSFVMRQATFSDSWSSHPTQWYVGGASNAIGLKTAANGAVIAVAGKTISSTTLATSTTVMNINQWTLFRVLVREGAGGTGLLKVWIGSEINPSINVACTITSATYFGFSCPQNNNYGPDWEIDDLWVGTATADTDVPDDNRVFTLFPDGNGTTSNGTGSDGNSTDNYLLVDETTVSTSDYVDVATGTQRDLYTMQNLPFANGTILGVQAMNSVERTDAGAADIKAMTKISANETIGSAQTPTFGSVSHMAGPVWTTKPGGGAWAATDVNDAEFGIETV